MPRLDPIAVKALLHAMGIDKPNRSQKLAASLLGRKYKKAVGEGAAAERAREAATKAGKTGKDLREAMRGHHPKWAGAKRFTLEELIRYPKLSATSTAIGLPFLLDPILGGVGGVKEAFTGANWQDPSWEDQVRMAVQRGAADLELYRMQERHQRLFMENSRRLAELDPHLYSEIMSGRRLPRGARVVGGTPRVDLMEQVAAEMAEMGHGSLSPQSPVAGQMGMMGGEDLFGGGF